MLRLLLIFLLITCFKHALKSQNFDLSWGNLERSPGSLLEILPKQASDFYSLRWSGGRSFGTYRVIDHENLQLKNQSRIKQVAQTGIANFETAAYLNNQLYVFLSDKADGNMLLYAQPYDEEMNPSEESILIASYANSKLGAKPNFSILSSDNRKYFAVFWEIPGRKSNQDDYGYIVLDYGMNTIQSGEYLVPFDGNMSTINEHHVTNSGDYFISITEHNKPNDRIFSRSSENFKALHVYSIRNNELNEFSIDIESKRIDDMEMSSNNNIFTLSGIYGTGRSGKVEGVFIIRYDTSKDEVLFKGFVKFREGILNAEWVDSEMRQPRNNRNRVRDRDRYRFKIRDIFTLEDGSLCGSIEQYFINERSSYDSRTGLSSSIYYYYYDDIVAFKIGKTGSFDWQKRISKSQVSTNDGGPFSSYSSFTDGQKLFFIFNDNLKNYDENGSFSRGTLPCYAFNLSRRKNTSALCEVTLSSGAVERKTLFTRKELNSIVVPKMFKLDISNQELLLYAISGSKEKFGILNFKNK